MAREQRTKFISKVGPGLPRRIPGKERENYIGIPRMPRTPGDFAHPLPYQVYNNSTHWRKHGIGVASI